ncbi:hypothetical protein A2331_00500 [Candidatus Falkowbacteria bacterium RIFOXYB2_FULL_34_18]|uniref:Uncharacterized protein n=1 Tax=Candidatus Falkowbacteria bacterium RIFOXYD2_FULL_34_120 TaxID=1798007 RepID=A0A1F5TP98_9BACT|nr:MAG: hypothetical protein A2331_00500 [Candidatus Falkowbacteria bacterium RIFOXYB2_FULL_34_18]OGF29034.1 MAG: hypothetical protein A2500_01900 [Candidatus Falkowbacteria bacterium RIFOXYC12_FULL_34_55]OGF36067.1 MAG: hypothetical protein A2466_00200 [Candidatus Falkowbacteria bacterium RIFOXYC2_FULL_34_220]OGF38545.1 MAG: hypothetical protein A2515_05160 [Candidatus Falkowbacteria bacterium RIFOXYD12_FULL_34_57]OGF40710.1 MAG: hypothetical protein A2531_05710 [Candidatus Falkowbacteria bact
MENFINQVKESCISQREIDEIIAGLRTAGNSLSNQAKMRRFTAERNDKDYIKVHLFKDAQNFISYEITINNKKSEPIMFTNSKEYVEKKWSIFSKKEILTIYSALKTKKFKIIWEKK